MTFPTIIYYGLKKVNQVKKNMEKSIGPNINIEFPFCFMVMQAKGM